MEKVGPAVPQYWSSHQASTIKYSDQRWPARDKLVAAAVGKHTNRPHEE